MSTETPTLRSFSAGRWTGRERAQMLGCAITGAPMFFTHGESIDFAEMLDFGRRTGVTGLLGFDFQQRATMLRALAKYLQERKEALYSLSYLTGATRSDSWVDIEGGIGTLLAYAGIGSNDFPDDVVFELFVREVAREMTSKAGQKCTARQAARSCASYRNGTRELQRSSLNERQ